MQVTVNSSPRIAFATTVYDQMSVGGGTFVHYLRQAVKDGRLDLVFFSDDMREQVEAYERSVEIPRWIRKLPGGWMFRSYYFHRAIHANHAAHPFDLIWHNNVITSLCDVLAPYDVPVVGMINDYCNVESHSPLASRSIYGAKRAFIRFLWRQLERYCARRVDHLVVNSKYMAERIGEAYDIDRTRLRLLYKGVDLDAFVFRPSKRLNSPVRILFLKRDFVRGGLLDLLEAMRTMPLKVVLTVLGPPRESHATIMSAATRAGVSDCVRVFDPVGREDIMLHIQNHDILCVPSRSEALGVAFMEGMASGIPVVGADVGGIPEVLDDGKAGWLAEAGNPQSISSVLLEIVENEDAREDKIKHARSHVFRFSYNRMIDEMRTIARSIANTPEVPEVCV